MGRSKSKEDDVCTENGVTHKRGESWSDPGVCNLKTCQKGGYIQHSKCPYLEIPRRCWLAQGDLSQQFPYCCPRRECPDESSSSSSSSSEDDEPDKYEDLEVDEDDGGAEFGFDVLESFNEDPNKAKYMKNDLSTDKAGNIRSKDLSERKGANRYIESLKNREKRHISKRKSTFETTDSTDRNTTETSDSQNDQSGSVDDPPSDNRVMNLKFTRHDKLRVPKRVVHNIFVDLDKEIEELVKEPEEMSFNDELSVNVDSDQSENFDKLEGFKEFQESPAGKQLDYEQSEEFRQLLGPRDDEYEVSDENEDIDKNTNYIDSEVDIYERNNPENKEFAKLLEPDIIRANIEFENDTFASGPNIENKVPWAEHGKYKYITLKQVPEMVKMPKYAQFKYSDVVGQKIRIDGIPYYSEDEECLKKNTESSEILVHKTEESQAQNCEGDNARQHNYNTENMDSNIETIQRNILSEDVHISKNVDEAEDAIGLQNNVTNIEETHNTDSNVETIQRHTVNENDNITNNVDGSEDAIELQHNVTNLEETHNDEEHTVEVCEDTEENIYNIQDYNLDVQNSDVMVPFQNQDEPLEGVGFKDNSPPNEDADSDADDTQASFNYTEGYAQSYVNYEDASLPTYDTHGILATSMDTDIVGQNSSDEGDEVTMVHHNSDSFPTEVTVESTHLNEESGFPGDDDSN